MKKTLSLITVLGFVSCLAFAQEAPKPVPVQPAMVKPAKPNQPIEVNPVGQPAPAQPALAVEPAQPDNPNASDIKFEIENHDFGTVEEGPKAAFDFNFTNTGKEPLILQDVHASCGCTVPSWPREPILPGQKNKIKVEYNTQGRPGAFNKAITVKSNGKTPTVMIYIKGTVQAATNGVPEKKPPMIEENKKQ